MTEIREGLFYTETHEWMKREGSYWIVGITDHAQRELTDVVFIEFIKKSGSVRKGEAIANVESVKTVSEIYSPLEGEIMSVNETLVDKPEKINQDPYGEGWIAKIKPSGDEGKLLTASEYAKLTGEN